MFREQLEDFLLRKSAVSAECANVGQFPLVRPSDDSFRRDVEEAGDLRRSEVVPLLDLVPAGLPHSAVSTFPRTAAPAQEETRSSQPRPCLRATLPRRRNGGPSLDRGVSTQLRPGVFPLFSYPAPPHGASCSRLAHRLARRRLHWLSPDLRQRGSCFQCWPRQGEAEPSRSDAWEATDERELRWHACWFCKEFAQPAGLGECACGIARQRSSLCAKRSLFVGSTEDQREPLLVNRGCCLTSAASAPWPALPALKELRWGRSGSRSLRRAGRTLR